MSDPKPPFPLPDLPRITPSSDLALLACRVLEWRDMEALTRLPDMLRDMGRDADANAVYDMIALTLAKWTPFPDRNNFWDDASVHSSVQLKRILWWDIFLWEQSLRVLGERFAEKPGSRGTSGFGGTLTVGGVDVPITQWLMHPHVEAVPIPSFTPPASTDEELHASESHPDYEYARTPYSDPPASHDEWEHNVPADARDDSQWYWRRRKAGAA